MDSTDDFEVDGKPVLVVVPCQAAPGKPWVWHGPDRLACIYGDAPVCNFKSWPGGKGKGKGSPNDWLLVLTRYHPNSEADALA